MSANSQNSIEHLIGHVGRVLVVDQHEANLTLVRNYLKQQNQYDVDTFTAGEEAWKSIENRAPDFIVMGWRLQGMSGIAFLNRIRRHPPTMMIPVLVTSGLINRNDFRLLDEFPCTRLLESPFTRLQFERFLQSLIKEKLWYKSNYELLGNLWKSARQDTSSLESQVRKILTSSPRPAPLAVLAARLAQKANDHDLAKKILTFILQKEPMYLPAINEMAKIQCHKRDYPAALDLLRHAMDVSPHSMQRLCLLGQVSLSVRDPDGAKRYFTAALNIDGHDRTARAGMTISENMINFPAGAAGVGFTESFASLLNTIGIALVRNGNFQKGIDQYKAALMFVHDSLDIAKVSFNLGLGYLRWRKQAEALQWFEKSLSTSGGQLGRSGNYVTMLKDALVKKTDARKRPVPPPGTGFSATDSVIKDAHLMPVQPVVASLPTEIDDLEERIAPRGPQSLSATVEQMLKASVADIDEQELVSLEEIA